MKIIEALNPTDFEEVRSGAPEPSGSMETGRRQDELVFRKRVQGGEGIAAALPVHIAGGDELAEDDRSQNFQRGGSSPHSARTERMTSSWAGLVEEGPETARLPQLEAAAGRSAQAGPQSRPLGSPSRRASAAVECGRTLANKMASSFSRRASPSRNLSRISLTAPAGRPEHPGTARPRGCSGRRWRGSDGRSGA